ncbi:MAG: thiamine pyrophosphate-binding protein [Alphaproteobacteria bacterium]|nr:thiamine pyrophosphate-binding protein [Alphaproteobacteria bacterium]
MHGNLPLRHGGKIVVDALKSHGVDTVFCLPGESFLGILDTLIDTPEIRLVTCRHEAGAAFMAEAYGKLTGKPAVCLVTRGPGACNASIGVHQAKHDSTPMLVLIGHATRYEVQREAFQEIEYRLMYSELTKWVAQIDSVDRIPEFISRGFSLASSGRMGPVALVMPEDMLDDECAIPDARKALPVQPEPSAAQLADFRARLAKAQRPFLIVGSVMAEQAVLDMTAFAEANAIPATLGFRRHDNFDMTSPCYAGDLGYGTVPGDLPKRVKQADLVIAVGTRLNTIITQDFTLFDRLGDTQELIHIHPSVEEIGRLYTPVLGIQAGVTEFAAAARALDPVDSSGRRQWVEDANAAYRETLTPPPCDGPLDLGKIMIQLREWLPEDAIVTIDAGSYSSWPLRFLQFKRPMRLLAGNVGAMGGSMPAGVAAAITCPDRQVVTLLGDGSALMTGQEIATAMQNGAKPIVILFNNDTYGTIRLNQENRYPGRVSATDLTNPDFAAWGRSFGAHGESVERTEDFLPALERAAASGRAAVIELRVDTDLVSARTTLSAARDRAFAAQKTD